MAIDLSNPAVVTAARAVARNISIYIGIPALNARRDELRRDSLAVEETYRLAEAAVEKTKREVNAIDAALKERDAELVLIFTEEKGADGKKKYAADGAKAAAVSVRKSDEDYVALKSALGLSKGDLDQAEQDFARAKARQRALQREHEMLRDETALAAARVGAFAGLDGDPPTTAAA